MKPFPQFLKIVCEAHGPFIELVQEPSGCPGCDAPGEYVQVGQARAIRPGRITQKFALTMNAGAALRLWNLRTGEVRV